MKKDFFTLLGGFLTSLLLFFGTIGISFEWFTMDSINAFVVVISAFVALVINGYAVWKNTFVTPKARQFKENALKAQGEIKK
ncbi:SPP1 phage holin family protein [Metabacillus halosaccharovorans]|uniref:SPP1 phage holin family protein n=1 Tax=Metabacillus halosaccharovorans TaxID=930124 RepID=A0ABT3DGP7_9BACI|nr:SPP1 phage holin family protein [Metabacillus halosaccharovorans]MCV9886229.1 SPP1 phage holin family protein [Metabacillus halosaccharovorans]